MIQSQVSNKDQTNFNSNVNGFSMSSISNNRTAIDPMKQSTMNYVRNVYRGLGNLPQERIKTISQNFIRLYGTNR